MIASQAQSPLEHLEFLVDREPESVALLQFHLNCRRFGSGLKRVCFQVGLSSAAAEVSADISCCAQLMLQVHASSSVLFRVCSNRSVDQTQGPKPGWSSFRLRLNRTRCRPCPLSVAPERGRPARPSSTQSKHTQGNTAANTATIPPFSRVAAPQTFPQDVMFQADGRSGRRVNPAKSRLRELCVLQTSRGLSVCSCFSSAASQQFQASPSDSLTVVKVKSIFLLIERCKVGHRAPTLSPRSSPRASLQASTFWIAHLNHCSLSLCESTKPQIRTHRNCVSLRLLKPSGALLD